MGDQLGGFVEYLLAATVKSLSRHKSFLSSPRFCHAPTPMELEMTEKQRRELEAARQAREEAIKAQSMNRKS